MGKTDINVTIMQMRWLLEEEEEQDLCDPREHFEVETRVGEASKAETSCMQGPDMWQLMGHSGNGKQSEAGESEFMRVEAGEVVWD